MRHMKKSVTNELVLRQIEENRFMDVFWKSLEVKFSKAK